MIEFWGWNIVTISNISCHIQIQKPVGTIENRLLFPTKSSKFFKEIGIFHFVELIWNIIHTCAFSGKLICLEKVKLGWAPEFKVVHYNIEQEIGLDYGA